MTRPHISVIVCTYNRAEFLRQALTSLCALHVPTNVEHEILVVDNGSADHTAAVVAAVASQSTTPIRYCREPVPGVSPARNRGIAEAHGNWLAFFDDDQLATPDWLANLLAKAEQLRVRCVAGTVHLLLPAATLRRLPAVCRSLLGESQPRPDHHESVHQVDLGTGNLLIQRSVFEQIGNFDESLQEAGEDTELATRIALHNIRVGLATGARVYRMVPPYRLSVEYFGWSARRNGMHVARRDLALWRWYGFPIILAVRLLQAALLFIPRWAAGRVLRRSEMALAGRCQLARIGGYIRHTAPRWLPSWSRSNNDFQQTAFRNERDQFRNGAIAQCDETIEIPRESRSWTHS